MEPCTILDLGAIAKDVEQTLGIEDAIMYVRQDMLTSKWFKDHGVSLQYQIIGNHKVTIHMYGKSVVSLETLRTWIIQCSGWIIDNTETTCILVYCRTSDMPLRFLLRACGARRIAILPEGNGEEDEILYVFSKKDREKYERRITCHKQ